MAVFRLDEKLWFPDPHSGNPDGLVAVGGDLSAERLKLAYSNGFFPWFSYRICPGPHWYCPLERFVIFPDKIHVSHSMKQLIRQHKYVVTFNEDFESVIENCSKVDDRNKEEAAWLSPDIISAYTRLHHMGYAASVEVWECYNQIDRQLVGGLYGVTLRNAFFGESMFSFVPSASKLALITLAQRLNEHGWHFIDCQFETPHLRSMGGEYISYEKYMEMLEGKG